MESPAGRSDAPPPYGTLIFDCDSTLSAIEGIDELSGAWRAEISELTRRAMAGELALQAVYGQRLKLLAPTRAAIRAVGVQYVAQALPHSRDLIAALRALGKRTCIVSGGLRAAVLALAEHLGVRDADVFAVEVFHDAEGNYVGFDENSPLARTGGKLGVVQKLAREDPTGNVALVGDGITDWEASPAARRFVAYGGVVRRTEVFERAQVHCDQRDLAALLPLLCTGAEIDALANDARHKPLIRAARG